MLETEDGHHKAVNFHNTIMRFYDKYFPEKSVIMSSFDKDWMHPDLKYLHRQMSREFYLNRKSEKWRKLYIRFRREKRKAVKGLNYNEFADQLIQGTKSNFYKQVKKVGGMKVPSKKMFISSLDGMSDKECAEAIGLEYAAISQAYSPVDLASLPAYLPAQLPPQVEEREVFEKLRKLKKTKSTFPIDLPEKLRKEFAPELAAPLADIYNCCLQQGIFPSIWKEELVTPVPKKEILKEVKDTRKITCLSDYSKIFEGFLKKWILEDLLDSESFSQFGGKKGIGAEHMIVCMVDRILKLLETTEGKAAVISSQYDWSNAFERQDPSKTIQKFIAMRIRSSLIPILIDFLSGRSMKIKFNGEQAGPFELVGGSPAGSFLGQLCYTTGCHDNTEALDIEEDDKYQYIDDLTLLELIMMADLLQVYDFRSHVASDIALDQRFLPPAATKSQDFHDGIALWTKQNLTKLNFTKSKYTIHSRMKESFATRFTIDGEFIERQAATKILGVWIAEDPSCWERNTQEIKKRTYASMSMLTKLKYAGLSRRKLLHIYSLFIRSYTEYCSVAWHDSLTQEQTNAIERLQKVALKIILGADCPRKPDGHFDYPKALVMCNLKSLFDRRETRMLSFGKKCFVHPS